MTFSKEISEIPYRAFASKQNLYSISFPETVNSIGVSAFSECKNLVAVNIENIKSIRGCAFSGCSNLEKIEFSHYIKVINPMTFMNCKKLEIENSESEKYSDFKNITTISTKAFYNCQGITSINLGSKNTEIKEIGSQAFRYCKNLTKVYLDKVAYTNAKSLIRALRNYGVSVSYDAFNDTGLSKDDVEYQIEYAIDDEEILNFESNIPYENEIIEENISDSSMREIGGEVVTTPQISEDDYEILVCKKTKNLSLDTEIYSSNILSSCLNTVGTFCEITKDASNNRLIISTIDSSDYIDYSNDETLSCCELGLDNGIIVGKSSLTDELYAFDGICPNCYEDSSVTHLNFTSYNQVTCPCCDRVYSLDNNEVIISSDDADNSSLFRYRASYSGSTLLIS